MNHPEEETYTCQLCKKNFTNEGYKRHMKKHDGKKHFECNICGKKFIENFNLTQHMRIHTGEKPFSCEFCYKSFNHKGNCEIHKKRHKGQRDHHCDICGKKFFLKINLENHKWIHTEVKTFSCEFCKKSFSNRSNCEKHKKQHKKKKDILCCICGNQSTQEINLEGLITNHTDEKSSKSQYYDKSLTQNQKCQSCLEIQTANKDLYCSSNVKQLNKEDSNKNNCIVQTVEKPYECQTNENNTHQVCGKSLNQKVHLERRNYGIKIKEHAFENISGGNISHMKTKPHMGTHDKNDEFHSCIFEENFFQNCNLEHHIQRLSDTRPFKNLFNRSFDDESDINHMPEAKKQLPSTSSNSFSFLSENNIYSNDKKFSAEDLFSKVNPAKQLMDSYGSNFNSSPQQGSLEECWDLIISQKTSLNSSDGLKFQTQSNQKTSSCHYLPQSFSSLPIEKQVVDCMVLNDSSTNFIPNSINETFNCFQMQQSLTSELDFGNAPSTSLVGYQTSVTNSENVQANSAIPITLSDNFAGSSHSQENSYHEENIQNQLECPSNNDTSQQGEIFSDMFIWTYHNRDSNLNQQQQPSAGHLLSKETYERNLKSQFLKDAYHFPY